MEPFVYTPLNERDGEIRLLTLFPGCSNSELRCGLEHVRLTETERPIFEALSYTWGSTTSFAELSVSNPKYSANQRSDRNPAFVEKADRPPVTAFEDGAGMVKITRNLAEALSYLFYPDRPRVLWIDAVCVNQSDSAERGCQVKRMANIYRWAERVVVWLGPESSQSTFAIETLKEIDAQVDIDWYQDRVRFRLQNPIDVQVFDSLEASPLDIQKMQAIIDLLNRGWFERLWILQEIRLADDHAVVLCGTDAIRWNTLANASRALLERDYYMFEEQPDLLYLVLSRIRHIHRFRYTGAHTLEALIHGASDSKCTDARDRIFGMLGMLQKWSLHPPIEPDYTASTLSVYRQTVLSSIKAKSRLNILKLCENTEDNPIWPSWVPNFDVPFRSTLMRGLVATGNSRCFVEETSNRSLKVAGKLLGTVLTIQQIGLSSSRGNIRERTELIARATSDFASSHEISDAYDDRLTLGEAFFQTICTGGVARSHFPPRTALPDDNRANEILQSIQRAIASGAVAFSSVAPHSRFFLQSAVNKCHGRAFITTAANNFGLVPEAVQRGDQICVLLGCDVPMLIRATITGQHRILGPCYLQGFTKNEALLGPIPGHFDYVQQYDEVSHAYRCQFVDVVTGEVNVEDPRLERDLPAGWSRVSHPEDHLYPGFEHIDSSEATLFDPRLSRFALEDQGVELQDFEFV